MKHHPFGILALLAASLAGCGGGSGSSSSSVGRVAVKIAWPEVSRVLPLKSSSVVVTLSSDPTLPGRIVTIARPTTTATFEEVPPGTYTILAEARPNADGTGTTQAKASEGGVVVVAGSTTTADTLALNSEVKRLRLAATSEAGTSTFTYQVPNVADPTDATTVATRVAVVGAPDLNPAFTGSAITTPISLAVSGLNLAGNVVLVSAGAAGFDFNQAANPSTGLTVGSPAVGDPTTVTLSRSLGAGPVGRLVVAYKDQTTGTSTAGATSNYAVFNIPVLVLRSLDQAPIADANTVDVDPNGATTNGAAHDNRLFANLDTAPTLTSAFDVSGLSGYATGDPIRVASTTSGKRYAIKVNGGNNILSDTDGNRTIATVGNILDVAASGNRVFVLATVAGAPQILELTISVGSVTIARTYTGATLTGATDLAATSDGGSGVILAVHRGAAVERYTVGTTSLTLQGTAVNLANAVDVAATANLTFVLDNAGKVHTYGIDAKEYGLPLALPAGANGLRIAAGVLDPGATKRTYVVVATDLANNEVVTFVEAGS